MFKQTVLAAALGMAFASAAYAADTDTAAPADTTTAVRRDKAQDLDTVSVIGSGETRQVQRLRAAADAVTVDTTGLSLEEVVGRVVGLARERGLA